MTTREGQFIFKTERYLGRGNLYTRKVLNFSASYETICIRSKDGWLLGYLQYVEGPFTSNSLLVCIYGSGSLLIEEFMEKNND